MFQRAVSAVGGGGEDWKPTQLVQNHGNKSSYSISVPSGVTYGILNCYAYGTNATWTINGATVELIGTSGTAGTGYEEREYYHCYPTGSTITASCTGGSIERGIDLIC